MIFTSKIFAFSDSIALKKKTFWRIKKNNVRAGFTKT